MQLIRTSVERVRSRHSTPRLAMGWRTALGSVLFLAAIGCGSSSSDPSGDGSGNGDESQASGGGSNGDESQASGGSNNGQASNGNENGSGTGGEGQASGGGSNAQAGFDQTIEGGGTQGDFHTFSLTVDGKNYNVQTNPWRGADQVITAGGGAIFTVDSMQEPDGLQPWDVVAFPSVYLGVAHAGANPTENSGLPATVGSLSSVPTGLATNASSITYTGNTTYDVYFTNAESYTSGGPDVYLMVWFHANGLNPINGPTEMWNCLSDPPTYIESCSGAGSVVIDGVTFYRFIGPNGPAQVISYVPETTMDSWEFDLKDFIDDAVDEGVVTEAMYLQSIQAGFELVTGGIGLTVEGFYADVQ